MSEAKKVLTPVPDDAGVFIHKFNWPANRWDTKTTGGFVSENDPNFGTYPMVAQGPVPERQGFANAVRRFLGLEQKGSTSAEQTLNLEM